MYDSICEVRSGLICTVGSISVAFILNASSELPVCLFVSVYFLHNIMSVSVRSVSLTPLSVCFAHVD